MIKSKEPSTRIKFDLVICSKLHVSGWHKFVPEEAIQT